MAWQIVGRPALRGRKFGRKVSALNARYGVDSWQLGHVVGAQLLKFTEAGLHLEASYRLLFSEDPALLDWLCTTALDVVQFAASNRRSEFDYSVQERRQEHVYDIALRRVVHELGRRFEGENLLFLGGRGANAEAIGPGKVRFHRPELIQQPPAKGGWHPESMECFWESNRVLLVKG